MLTIPQIQTAVNNIAPQYPIKKVLLFGSYAMGTATENSDLDVLVEYTSYPISYYEIGGLQEELQDELGVEVDVVTLPFKKAFPEFEIGRTVCLYDKT